LKKNPALNPAPRLKETSVGEQMSILRGALKRPIWTHTGEKPFSCGDCETSLTEKVTLNRPWLFLTHRRVIAGKALETN
jgi:hypothetical protein